RTDIRFSDNWSDRLVVSGTADLAGLVSVNVSGDLFDGIDKDFKILTAAGGLTLGDVGLSNPTLRGTISRQNDTDAILSITDIDFDPAGLDEAAAPLAGYLDDIFKEGVPDDLQPLMGALLSIPDIDTYKEAITQIEPEEYAQDLANSYGYGIDFTNRLLSCRVANGPNRFKAEGDCDWVGARISNAEQDATDSMSAYNQTLSSFEAGIQRRAEGPWRVGAGMGFTNSAATAADGSTVQDTQGQAGVVLKYDADAWLLAAALTGGFGNHHTERGITIGNVDQTLIGDAPVAYASTRLNAAYTFDFGSTYIKPLVNVDLTASYFGGVTETGGSGALTIDPAMEYEASFNPAIEIGGEFGDGHGNLIRPYAQVGVQASVMSESDLTARFVAVDPDLGGFAVPTPTNEPALKLSLGADVLTKTNDTLRLFYDGAFSASSRKNSVGLKVSHNF
ncbi:MAG TPA: autotransporter outer membrane beta-barrel domain-containing protein, partial [Bauldia sp.]|nr:autotransporter outer membrane beta-barrel domain-containing protein [Bauldia sp.]